VKSTKRQILIVTLCLIAVLVSVSAVSAVNVYVNTTGDDDTGTGTISNPFKSISKGVNNATDGDTVIIADGTYAGENNTYIDITKNMTITGQSQANTIIDGEGVNWIFSVDTPGLNVTFSNLTIKNAYINWDNGAAIWSEGSTVTVSQCTFIDNNANGNGGGAIYSGYGNLTVDDSTFISNNAMYGAAINNIGGYLTVRGCNFTENVATALEEDYGLGGGAIYNWGLYGDGIYPATLIVEGCTFQGNVARDGGAIYGYGLSNCTITNSIFADNRATSVDGGAIENNGGILNLTNCIFTNNTANGNGGAVFTDGDFSAVNCTFTNNTAYTGGAIYAEDSNSVITGCNFTGNTVTSEYDGYEDYGYGGAAIYNDEGLMNIVNCNFNQNDATASDGAAIHNFAGELNVTGSNFTFNEGGSIINDHLYFNEGPAPFFTEGDGFFNYGVLNVINCTFLNNTCIWNGAAIWTDGPCTVTGSVFVNNTAGYEGGAIFNEYDGLLVNFCRFAGNTAEYGNDIYSNILYYPETPEYPEPTLLNGDGSAQNIENNWWGSNDPDFDTLLYGVEDPVNWLYMTITATPNIINNGETSNITVSFNNLFNGTDLVAFDPSIGHIPDGTPVVFNTDLGSIGSKTIQKFTLNGVATATLTADELAGVAHINATTDNQTVYVNVTINPKSSLYLTITPTKADPKVGDTVVYILKVGNNGPDTAKDVVVTYVIPTGLEFAGATKDVGNWTYDNATRTITWTIGDVPVGDPYLNLSLYIAQAGLFPLNPQVSTSTYDPTLGSSVQSLTVLAAEKTNGNGTVPMQNTGVPVNYLFLALLMVLGGFLAPKRK